MEEDFIIEEEGEGSSSRRPFLIAAGALTAVFILASVCSIGFLTLRPSSDQDGKIAARETENANIAITNEAVTLTIAAIQTEDARPATDTPQPTATATPPNPPTNTPAPTDTRVVVKPEAAEEDTATPNFSGTSAFETTEDSTPTPIAAFSNGNGDDESLPQTGLELWGAMIAALLLIATLVIARRLRSA